MYTKGLARPSGHKLTLIYKRPVPRVATKNTFLGFRLKIFLGRFLLYFTYLNIWCLLKGAHATTDVTDRRQKTDRNKAHFYMKIWDFCPWISSKKYFKQVKQCQIAIVAKLQVNCTNMNVELLVILKFFKTPNLPAQLG